MTNWQTFKVLGVEEWRCSDRCGSAYSIKLDKYVEFSDDYQKSINVRTLGNRISSYGISCGRFEKPYIDIDIDKTKRVRKSTEIPNDAWRIVPNEVIDSRSASTGREIAERLIREVDSHPPGKVEFEHRIEHRDRSPERFIYRRNY